MRQYLNLLDNIIKYGDYRPDRTGIGTFSVFGRQLRFDLGGRCLPVITTKKIHLKSVIHELLWFISGSSDISDLEKEGVTIWSPWKDRNNKWNYSKAWNYGDQLNDVVENLIKDPYSRRHLVSAWDVEMIAHDGYMLPPCHVMFQFYVAPFSHRGYTMFPNYLSCHMYQRSADCFLGLPFNITSYALLTHMVAKLTGLQADELVISIGDAHIYINHADQVREQLTRTPLTPPTIKFNSEDKVFEKLTDFKYDDICVLNYKHHDKITAPVAV